MYLLVSILGLILAALALCERRAWPFLLVILSVWWMTEWAESLPDRLQGLSYRIGFDVVGGVVSLLLVHRKADLWVPGLFVLMLLNHATYWMARWMGTDLWLVYAYGISVLWLIQLATLAVPGGRVGVRAVVGRYRAWRGLGSSVGDGRSCPADPV